MKGQLKIMKVGEGDRSVEWDTEAQETVDAAKALFAEHLLGGGMGFVTLGENQRRITEFDELAERIVVTMPTAGG